MPAVFDRNEALTLVTLDDSCGMRCGAIVSDDNFGRRGCSF
jgi:hypothetical protein